MQDEEELELEGLTEAEKKQIRFAKSKLESYMSTYGKPLATTKNTSKAKLNLVKNTSNSSI